jgi:DNA-binding IclR family transcriptional regulator
MGIADLADHLHGSRSTTHRYATTLVELGYLQQDASRKYHLGTRAADVGVAVIRTMPLHQHACPLLEELRLQTNYTVSLGILDEDRVLYLEVLHGSRPGQHKVDLDLSAGSRAPLHCTAIGKTLLAHLPDAQQKSLIAQITLAKHAPNTITSKKVLREALAYIHEQGLATDEEESTPGAQGIAVPIIAAEGELLGGIALLAPPTASNIRALSSAHSASLSDTAHRLAGLVSS